MELNGRVALVTGAAKRVGRAIALRLARGGCALAVHYRSSETEAITTATQCRAYNVPAETFAADLTDPAAPARLVGEVLRRFGRLDVLVNNASTFEPMRLDDFDGEKWDETLRVNLTAPLALAFAAREALRLAQGRIINLCDAGTSRPWAGHLAYIVSKGGLDTLTNALAKAFAPDVTVNGVAPGIAEFPEEYDAAQRAKLIAKVPLKRAGSPDDIAAAVHYLVTEGDYITGTILNVDGGRSIA